MIPKQVRTNPIPRPSTLNGDMTATPIQDQAILLRRLKATQAAVRGLADVLLAGRAVAEFLAR